jgi:hypothetical protein
MPFAGDISGAVSDLFAASADKSKAQYDLMEGQEYTLASDLATQNAQFTQDSTAIKETQINREETKALGTTTANLAGAGFATSGSGLDILRETASSGSIAKAAANQQGLITEAGYNEQAASYTLMATAADQAAAAEETAAKGAYTGAIISGAAAIFDFGALAGNISGGGGGGGAPVTASGGKGGG